MTARTAAVVFLIVGAALGWYGSRWWIAEHDEISTGARHRLAKRIMWATRLGLALAVAVAALVLNAWYHS